MPDDHAFARGLRSIAVTSVEAAHAASCFTLVFVPGPTGLMPQALLRRGKQGHSPFVGPDSRWQASWLPPRLAAWPFDLVGAPGGGHALALHEESDLVSKGAGQHPIFVRDGDAAPRLAPQTEQIAALLKGHAKALPATLRATAVLRDLGLLTALDGDVSMMVIDANAAVTLDEAGVLALHRSGSLALLHAGLVSLSHLPWMEKAERLLAQAPRPRPPAFSNRPRAAAGSRFLAALAAEASADEAPIQIPELSRQ